MKVCYVYQDEYPWDIRVDKITRSLADRGMRTFIISRNRTGLPRDEQPGKNLYIRRLPAFRKGLARELLNFPAFFSPFWFWEILNIVVREDIDAIIVRDLPLVPTGYVVGKLARKPVIIDMAENYPAMLQDTWAYGRARPLDYLIRNPVLLKKMEEVMLPLLDGIMVVSPESKARVEKLMRGRKKEIWIVGNTPRLEPVRNPDRHPAIDRLKGRDGLLLLYVGGLEEARGLDTVIKAIPIVREKIGPVSLMIVGTGPSLGHLRNLAQQIGVGDQIYFTGWVPQEHVPGIIGAADICLIPHYVSEHINTTLPNKLFDYMARKKPVIASNSLSLGRVINTSHCGLTYPDRDYQKLADAVVDLADPEKRKMLGEAGHEAVVRCYNWNLEEKALIEGLSRVVRARTPGDRA